MEQAIAAAAYVRISEDKLGDAAGVGRQEEDCRALASRNGWTITEIYTENDTSAYQRRTVRLPDDTVALRVFRPAFRKLLADLASGAVDALVAYDLDRVARDPRDLEDLIGIVERRKIPTTAVTGNLDLSTDAGILVARINVAVANKSSRDTGRRVARKHLELAQQGKVGGGGTRPYGYGPDRRTIVEAEASVIREVAARILAGESLTGVGKDLTARGVPTVQGATRWTTPSVRSIVAKARNAGLREHNGEIVGAATWPAILDLDVWQQVMAALKDRAAHGSSNQLRAWLTGVLFCSLCGKQLHNCTTQSAPGVRVYRCWKPRGGCGKIAITTDHCHDTVRDWILDYLRRPDVILALTAASARGSAAQVRSQAAEDEQLLKELATQLGQRKFTMAEYMAAREPVVQRLGRAKGILDVYVPAGVRTLLKAAELEPAWKQMRPQQRREVARLVFAHGINVLPANRGIRDSKGRSVFDPTRLQPIPEDE